MISGVLKEAGHETGLVHVNEKLFELPDEAGVVERVRSFAPGLIGFSIMSQQYPWSLGMAKAVREAFPEIPLVAGGVHCTMVPEEVVSDGAFDVVAVGEAELAFLDLVETLERGDDPTGVPNMRFPARSRYHPKGLTPIVNPVGAFPDLDDIAPNHYELFDMQRIVDSKNGWFGVLTSRGCPYKCTYCFNKEIVDRYLEDGGAKRSKEYLRHYSVERVIGELTELKRRYPKIKTLIFDDDLFTLDRKYVAEFCDAYKASGLGMPFVVNMHVQVFDEDMAFRLREAGCFMVKYGLESGSIRLRKETLWRYMSNERILKATRIAHQYDLHSSAFVMFGLPTETREEVMETLQLCAQTELGRVRWAIFFPFPGTAAHRISADLNLIDPERLKGVGNYFDGSCLKLGSDMDLLVAKLSRVAHWWINAFSDWDGCAEVYRPLVEEVDSWGWDEWEEKRGSLRERDRKLSERLLTEGIRHYSIRYTHVMAVDSQFVLAERKRMADSPEYVPVGYTLDD
jgi:anaerobic magnesium-protoporphyrin IX monomethyl ester cyclase